MQTEPPDTDDDSQTDDLRPKGGDAPEPGYRLPADTAQDPDADAEHGGTEG